MKNFGQIKSHIVNRLTTAYINKELSENNELKKYLGIIKESEILKTEFAIYRNLERFSEANEFSGSEYLKGNISIMESYTKADIIKEHVKLMDTFNITTIDLVADDKLGKLHESITNLIFLDKNIKNISAISESTTSVVNYFKNNIVSEKKVIDKVDSNLLTSVAKDKIKERYEDKLSSEELLIIETILKGDALKQEELLKDMVKECIEFVNTRISEADLAGKEKLLNVKASLLDINFTSETFKDDATRVLTLLSGFKQN